MKNNTDGRLKISRRGFIKSALGAAGSLILSGSVKGCAAESGREKRNPHRYDISEFRKVDPSLILYEEVPGINTPRLVITDLAVTSNGLLSAASGRDIYLYGTDLKPSGRFSLPEDVSAIAAAANGEIALGFSSRIDLYTARGRMIRNLANLQGNGKIRSIACGDGIIAATDALRKSLWIFRMSGGLAGLADSGFVIPGNCFPVRAGLNGDIWAGNPGMHRLERYSPAGKKLSQWGSSSMLIEGFAGCCNPEDFVIDRHGNFFTSEKGIPRIKKYGPAGEFIGVVAPPEAFAEETRGLPLAADPGGRVYAADNRAGLIRVFSPKDTHDG